MTNHFLKIGHRGAKGYVAENTLESIQKALDLDVDAIEIDVHLCKTGELVVFHDFTLDRMTNGSGDVGKKSLSELKQLKVNGSYRIPTLLEVLDLIDNKAILNIELKGQLTALETCKSIQYYLETKGWSLDNFIVSSFQKHELKTVHEIDQEIPLAILTKANLDEAMEFADTINTKWLHPNSALLSVSNVKRAKDLGFKINTWTVNDKKTIQRMIAYGVDGIISDFPDRL